MIPLNMGGISLLMDSGIVSSSPYESMQSHTEYESNDYGDDDSEWWEILEDEEKDWDDDDASDEHSKSEESDEYEEEQEDEDSDDSHIASEYTWDI